MILELSKSALMATAANAAQKSSSCDWSYLASQMAEHTEKFVFSQDARVAQLANEIQELSEADDCDQILANDADDESFSSSTAF